ncbi:hypothetical protein ACB092_04G027500 [Castanea dentata]
MDTHPPLAAIAIHGSKGCSRKPRPAPSSPLPPISNSGVVTNIPPLFPIMSIIYTSCTLGTMFMLLPREQVDGSPVPTLVFKDQPTAFHALLISIMFSFTDALTALLIQHRPRIERFCRVYAMASMLSALAILLYATAFCGFRYLLICRTKN